ncbi:hypothetical protein [Litoribaculum gwangyangense]|uniref:hypothetical protein n=1 Tax=Litoribaculum gwangyangense TaxID=1130722 RepID=UPI0031F0FBF3
MISQNQATNELFEVISKLRQDTNHNFLKTLQPLQSDFSTIFSNEETAQSVFEFSNGKWVDIDKVSDKSMKPLNSSDQAIIVSANKKELIQGITNGLPEEYKILSNHIKEDVEVYGFQYLNSDGSVQKTRAAFFKVNHRWILIPQTFMAFQ